MKGQTSQFRQAMSGEKKSIWEGAKRVSKSVPDVSQSSLFSFLIQAKLN